MRQEAERPEPLPLDADAADTAAAAMAPPVETPFRRFCHDFAQSPLALVGLAGFLVIAFAAIFAEWITPQNPYDLAQLDILDGRLPPGSEGFAGFTYWLGTDDQGRDMLSAIIYGLRISLSVGAGSTVVALLIGGALGLVAAYYGGRLETLIMRVVDLQLSFPPILVALILLAILGRGVDKVLIALIMVQWAYYARTIRGTALVERGKEYVQAARLLGYSDARILFNHIMPNTLAPVTVVLTIEFAHAIALEATLSFLGVGLPITEPSLGFLISAGFAFLLNGEYWISIFPGIALLIAVFSLNLLGDQLRDVLNPRLQK